MPDTSVAASKKEALDAPQSPVHADISGIVSLLTIFLAVQIVAMIAGSFVGRKLYPDSREKRQFVFGVARLIGVVAGGAAIYLWAKNRSGW
jgi:predicted permease